MPSQAEYHPLPRLADDWSDGENVILDQHNVSKPRHSQPVLVIFVLSLVINLVAVGWIVNDSLSPDYWLAWRGAREQWCEYLLVWRCLKTFVG